MIYVYDLHFGIFRAMSLSSICLYESSLAIKIPKESHVMPCHHIVTCAQGAPDFAGSVPEYAWCQNEKYTSYPY